MSLLRAAMVGKRVGVLGRRALGAHMTRANDPKIELPSDGVYRGKVWHSPQPA